MISGTFDLEQTAVLQRLCGNASERLTAGRCRAEIPSFDDIMQGIVDAAGCSDAHKISSEIAGEPDTGGRQWAELLRKHFAANGQSLDSLEVDSEALKALEDFLTNAGFDIASVQDMIENLQCDAEEGNLKLTDVLNELDQLEASDAMSADGDEWLDISALPYLESILMRLGLDQNQAGSVLNGAKAEGQGIDVSRLVSGLQEFKGTAFWSGAPGIQASQQERTMEMLNRIGLNHPDSRGAASIDSCIASLEKMLDDPVNYSAASRKLDDDMNHFLEKIQTGASEDSGSGNVFSLESPGSFELSRAGGEASRLMSGSISSGNGLFGNNFFQTRPNEASTAPFQTRGGGDGVEQTAAESMFLKTAEKALNSESGSKTFLTAAGAVPQARAENHEGNVLPAETLYADGAVTDMHEFQPLTGDSATVPSSPRGIVPSYVAEQVGRQIIRTLRNDGREISFQLKPAHLGRLQMRIDQGMDGLKVSIVTEHEAARDLLMNHSNELKTALMDMGIQLDKITVQTTPNFDQFTADARQHGKGSGQKKGIGSLKSVRVPPADISGARELSPLRRGESSVYLVA